MTNYGIHARTFGFNHRSRILSGCCGVSGWRRTMKKNRGLLINIVIDVIFLLCQLVTLLQLIVLILNDVVR